LHHVPRHRPDRFRLEIEKNAELARGLTVDALSALRQATALDRARFEPFPFKRYEPLAILGVGGFGTGFHCRDRYSKEEVAIKALLGADLAHDLNEVFAEAHVLRKLNHPGIIGIRDQAFADSEAERRPYFVLEHFPGVSLDAHREKHGPLSATDLVPLARLIAVAVQAAHNAGILHRDLKPANVLARRLGTGWDVRVIDFGLAVRHAAAAQTIAVPSEKRTQRERSFAGSLRYAAPEQKGELVGVPLGRYSDTYAFGKTCQELLFGHTEPQDEDWNDLPQPWGERWRKLLGACLRNRRFPAGSCS
jgi:serine/threonine protein kinase